jgi:hypothetical protein
MGSGHLPRRTSRPYRPFWIGRIVTLPNNGTYRRFAYADPPYLGCCAKYGHRHEEPYGCWDSPGAHSQLFDTLAEFDGWAYSLSSTSLAAILRIAPDARIAAWVKPFAAYKANVRIAYTWEAVLFVPGRDLSKDGAPVGRDHLAEPITLERGLTGAKPERFCRWILDLLGYVDGDELIDLFPGTGIMDRVSAQGRLTFAARADIDATCEHGRHFGGHWCEDCHA